MSDEKKDPKRGKNNDEPKIEKEKITFEFREEIEESKLHTIQAMKEKDKDKKKNKKK